MCKVRAMDRGSIVLTRMFNPGFKKPLSSGRDALSSDVRNGLNLTHAAPNPASLRALLTEQSLILQNSLS